MKIKCPMCDMYRKMYYEVKRQCDMFRKKCEELKVKKE